jgi:hypothetical protein
VTGVHKNMTRAIIALVFRCKIAGGALATNDEAAGFRWAAGSELPGLVDEAYGIRVLDALREVPAAAVRPHDGARLLLRPRRPMPNL